MPWRTNRVAFETQLSDAIRYYQMLFCSELGQSGNSESIAILALANRIQTQLAESIRNPNPRSANKRKSQAHVQDVRHAGTRLSEKYSGTRIQQHPSEWHKQILQSDVLTSDFEHIADVAQGAHIRMTPGWGLLPGQLPDRTGHTASGLRLASSAGTLVVFTRTHTPGRSKQKITIMLPYLHVLLCKLWFGQACFESCYDDYYY